jgi:hypothetical protein
VIFGALLVGAVLVAIWIWVSVLFDRIVKYHHDNYYEDWLSKDRPRGFFYVPREAKTIYSGAPFYVYAARLRKGLPDWARQDESAKVLIQRYVFWEKVWMVVVIVAIPTIIFLIFE